MWRRIIRSANGSHTPLGFYFSILFLNFLFLLFNLSFNGTITVTKRWLILQMSLQWINSHWRKLIANTVVYNHWNILQSKVLNHLSDLEYRPNIEFTYMLIANYLKPNMLLKICIYNLSFSDYEFHYKQAFLLTIRS